MRMELTPAEVKLVLAFRACSAERKMAAAKMVEFVGGADSAVVITAASDLLSWHQRTEVDNVVAFPETRGTRGGK